MKEDKTIIAIVAMACITILQVVNMFTTRIDSGLMAIVISALSLYAGYNVGKIKVKPVEEVEAEAEKEP